MPTKKWNGNVTIGFRTESYLKEALIEDMREDGFDDFTIYMNTILLQILGGDNNAVKQFRKEHPSYK